MLRFLGLSQKISVTGKILKLFSYRYSCTRAIIIALICTFFDAFNIPVFWPILVMYFIILFVLTMKRQIKVSHSERSYEQLETRHTRVKETVDLEVIACIKCGNLHQM